jgi:D-amino-acid dehydrogenase
MKVIVIGAGVVGLCAAYELQRRGVQVTVIDRAQAAAQGASRANGAQLSYAYVAPLAEPSVFAKLPALLLDPNSPLKLSLRFDLAQWAWGLKFLAAANTARARATTRALLALSALSRRLVETCIEEEGIDCRFTRGGKLVVFPDAASLAAARAQVRFQAGDPNQQSEQQMLDRVACIEREPALAGYIDRIAGGVWTPTEAAADCGMFCDALARVLQERGARFELGCEVNGLTARSRGAVRVHTDRAGELAADAVVIANGSHAPRLARCVRLSLPVYPLKGYSITVPLASGQRGPRVSITDTRRKVVFAPLDGAVRVAGFVELAGHDARIPQARIDALIDATREVIGIEARGELAPWCGFRPATPTGLPILGATPAPGVFVNTGQGALGWTLAAASAAVVADAILDRPPALDTASFAYR